MKRKKQFYSVLSGLISILVTASCMPVSALNEITDEQSGQEPLTYFQVNNKITQRTAYDTVMSDSLSLTDYQLQELKKEIHNAVAERKTTIDISGYFIPYDQNLNNLLISVIAEDPDNIVADVDGYYSYKLSYSRYYYAVQLNYLSDDEVLELKSEADKLLVGLDSENLSDAQKALIVHDRLAIACKYDDAADDAHSDDCFTAYGALVNKIAVCEGYAKAYMYLMNRLGITTEMADSKTLNHAWNIVTINGKRYHVDVSHDDTVPDLTGRVNHNYFLISTEKLRSVGKIKADDFDTSPQSTDFENSAWKNIKTNFVLFKDKIYYISKEGNLNELKDNETETVLPLTSFKDSVWYGNDSKNIWDGFYGMLSNDENALYFSLAKHIYRYVPDKGDAKIFFTPGETNKSVMSSIYRFVIDGDNFDYIISETPDVLSSAEVTHFNYQAVFVGQSAELRGDIGMNFYMKLSNKAKTKDAYLEFKISGLGENSEKILLSDIKPESDGTYTFRCPVNTLQMADTITAEYHYNDCTVTLQTSVADYILKIVENSARKNKECSDAKILAQALANYGYFAQKSLADHHGFKIDEDHKRMIVFNSKPDKDIDLSGYADVQTGSAESIGADSISYSLALDSKTDILLCFKMKEDQTLSESDFICNTDHPTSLEKTDDGEYLFRISDICASELDRIFNVSVKNSLWTIDISALSYAYSILSSDASENDKNACAALYNYYKEAKNYLNKNTAN